MQRFSWETCTVCAAGANVLMLRAGVKNFQGGSMHAAPGNF